MNCPVCGSEDVATDKLRFNWFSVLCGECGNESQGSEDFGDLLDKVEYQYFDRIK